MTTAKIYYLKQTGEIVLHIPENQSQWATPTTRAQDEQMYSALQSYQSTEVELTVLEAGQYASEFMSAIDYRVNIETLELEFAFPYYSQPLGTRIDILQQQNSELISENTKLKSDLAIMQSALDELIMGGM